MEWAVCLKRVELMRLLLKAGADPNQKDWYDDPLLFSAVKTKSVTVVRTLLEAGANPNATNGNWSVREAAHGQRQIEHLIDEAIRRRK